MIVSAARKPTIDHLFFGFICAQSEVRPETANTSAQLLTIPAAVACET